LPVYSMTGFARTEDYNKHCSWIWEVRSVNGKGLDVRSRLPSGFENLESTARDQVKKSLSRGNISISLSVEWVRKGQAFAINEDILNNYVNLLPQLSRRVPDATPVSMDGLLNLKGVIESSDRSITEDVQTKLEIDLLESLDETLVSLQVMRADEGKILGNILNQQVNAISSLCKAATKVAATQPDVVRKSLKGQVSSLLEDVSSLSPERLEQEAALLMTKADVSEELDRLSAHVVAAQDLLKLDSAIGRKLDFICQEFNREANTLCSKSGDIELTRIGLDMKATIEKFREQVQNIE
jgi:uncharacterized protein (TIGR00255 family)